MFQSKRVLTARQRKSIIKIIRFYAAQIATEINCHLNRRDKSERYDAFNIETKHFCVCIDFEIAIYDEKEIVTTRIR